MSHLFHIFLRFINSLCFVVQCNNPIYAAVFLILAFFNASALVLLSGWIASFY
jgi:NADH:ubiquinone oxidoreductase subunit 6 (subunit J)